MSSPEDYENTVSLKWHVTGGGFGSGVAFSNCLPGTAADNFV